MESELPKSQVPKDDSLEISEPDDLLEVAAHGKWHLVTLTQPYKRDLFCKQLEIAIDREQLQDLILRVEAPQEAVYQNLVLLELSSLKAVRDRIHQIGYVQRIDPKPLTPEQVERML